MPTLPPTVIAELMKQRGGRTPADQNTLMSALAANPQMMQAAMNMIMPGGGERQEELPTNRPLATAANMPPGITPGDIQRMQSDPSRYGKIYGDAAPTKQSPSKSDSKGASTRAGGPPLPPKRPKGGPDKKATPVKEEPYGSGGFPWWLALAGLRAKPRAGRELAEVPGAEQPRLEGPRSMLALPPPGTEGRPMAMDAAMLKAIGGPISPDEFYGDEVNPTPQYRGTNKNPERRYVQGTANPAGDVSGSAFNEEIGRLLGPGDAPQLNAPPPRLPPPMSMQLPDTARAAPPAVIPMGDQSWKQILEQTIQDDEKKRKPSKSKGKGAEAPTPETDADMRKRLGRTQRGRRLKGRGV